jgi:hypothetical protein
MGRSMHRRLRGSLAIVMALWIGTAAVPAQGAVINDPAKARGPLDLRRLQADKHDAGAPIRLSILTYGSWKARLLDVDGRNRIFVLFNPDRTAEADFIGEIFFRDGALWMRVTRRNGTFVRLIRAYHPTRFSVRATIPRGLPNPDGHSWLAATETFTTASGPCSLTCQDRIPDRGWLKLTPGS